MALSRRLDEFVKFPETQEERDIVKQGLYEIANFPCAICVIDAAHIRIIAPTDNEWDFVNRKRYHSINVQGICDHKVITGCPKKVPSLEIRPFVLNVRCDTSGNLIE